MTHYSNEIFSLFYTPQTKKQRPAGEVLKMLKSDLQISPSGIMYGMSLGNLFIISPGSLRTSRKRASQAYGFNSVFVNMFELLNLEYFVLEQFNLDVKDQVLATQRSTIKDYATAVQRLVQFNKDVTFCLEDVYWIEHDLRLIRARQVLQGYRKTWGIETLRNDLTTRLRDLTGLVEALARGVEVEEARRSARGFNWLSLIFASFSAGEVSITFIIWYYSSLLHGENIPIAYVVGTLGLTASIIICLVAVGLLFIRRIAVHSSKH